MPTLIALRKQPRLFDLPATQSITTTREKRLKLIGHANLNTTQRTDKLEEEGFTWRTLLNKLTFKLLGHDNGDEPTFDRLGYIGAYVINVTDEQEIRIAQESFSNDYYLLPNITLTLPAPPLPATQATYLDLAERPEWPSASGVVEAHRLGVLGSGVRVGVLDTGCDADHAQFRDKRIEFLQPTSGIAGAASQNRVRRRAFDSDADGHGTHVCGIIAGEETGVAPAVDLMVAGVVSSTYQTTLQHIVIALDWMLSRFAEEKNLETPTIINMSLGFNPAALEQAQELSSLSLAMRSMLATLFYDFDVLPVVAVGNEGAGKLLAPGYFEEVLSVGAVDYRLKSAAFSGSGVAQDTGDEKPDIVGYGVDVYSSLLRDPDGNSIYGTKNGTSMAAPYVTGIAALYASRDPKLQGEALRQKLVQTALPIKEKPLRVGAGLARFVP
ncbi:MAG: S8 family serine peptidase [Anaerolineae bacterium]|nr:S8 family serine peptidase [Anaerolineae bacterium]